MFPNLFIIFKEWNISINNFVSFIFSRSVPINFLNSKNISSFTIGKDKNVFVGCGFDNDGLNDEKLLEGLKTLGRDVLDRVVLVGLNDLEV